MFIRIIPLSNLYNHLEQQVPSSVLRKNNIVEEIIKITLSRNKHSA